jgi:HSP20 family protein
MANIAVRKEVGEKPRPATIQRWDPLRVMRQLMRWDPFTEMLPTWATEEAELFEPAFEVKENREGFLFKADLPGVDPKDLDVKVTQNRLTITGKREAEKEEKTDTYYACERSYGSFTRSFTLPEGVNADKIHAELKDGVLTLMLPKRPELQPKQVQVKTG